MYGEKLNVAEMMQQPPRDRTRCEDHGPGIMKSSQKRLESSYVKYHNLLCVVSVS